ncbi:MAG: M56 family metallopeptidase [Chitinophagaceae bacterium]|nr:MAG: M56 family metallopeptidase [Chitinophagaceae bacterium]
MIYLAKFILCSGLFYLAYLLLFEKERMNQFKRFYLLFSLALSFVLPLITFEAESEIVPIGALYNFEPTSISATQNESTAPSLQTEEHFSPLLYSVFGAYIGITLLLLARFAKNMGSLIIKVRQGKKAVWRGVTIVLNAKESAAYSFMNYIFVSQSDYENDKIHEGILQHELAHIKQKHSIDVILIELLQIFLWFNPFLYFYRKAIQINHEYLADESVIHHHQTINAYQLILINYISTQSGLSLTSQFNYLTIKKRLIMMSKTNSLRDALGKQLLLLPFLALALFLFSTKIEAQETQKKLTVKDKSVGLNETEQKEYNTLVDKYFGPPGNKFKGLSLSKTELARLETLFKAMSNTQKDNAKISFIKLAPVPHKTPSEAQLATWQSGRFGIWIDSKRIENSQLKEYKPSEFSYWGVGRLTKRAVNYGKFDAEVYLMTNAKFEHDKNKPRTAMLINNGKNVVKFKNSTRM